MRIIKSFLIKINLLLLITIIVTNCAWTQLFGQRQERSFLKQHLAATSILEGISRSDLLERVTQEIRKEYRESDGPTNKLTIIPLLKKIFSGPGEMAAEKREVVHAMYAGYAKSAGKIMDREIFYFKFLVEDLLELECAKSIYAELREELPLFLYETAMEVLENIITGKSTNEKYYTREMSNGLRKRIINAIVTRHFKDGYKSIYRYFREIVASMGKLLVVDHVSPNLIARAKAGLALMNPLADEPSTAEMELPAEELNDLTSEEIVELTREAGIIIAQDQALEDQSLSEEATPEQHVLRLDLNRRFEIVLQMLTERERKLMLLNIIEDEDVGDIAKIYSITRERASQLIAKGLRKFRHYFKLTDQDLLRIQLFNQPITDRFSPEISTLERQLPQANMATLVILAKRMGTVILLPPSRLSHILAKAETPAQQATRLELSRKLTAAFAGLSERQRKITLMHHVQDLTPSAIAEEIDLSPTTIASIIDIAAKNFDDLFRRADRAGTFRTAALHSPHFVRSSTPTAAEDPGTSI